MMMFKLAATTARNHSFTLHALTFSWEQLAEVCTTYEIGLKDGSALIPAIFSPCPEGRCRNKGTGNRECGGGKPHRLDANVLALTALGADFDDIATEDFEAIKADLVDRGLSFLWWETHGSGKVPGTIRARILIPFATPLPIASPKHWSHGLWPALLRHFGWERAVAKADRSCRNPSRIYYTPRKPSAAAERKAGSYVGELLDWESIPELKDVQSSYSKVAEHIAAAAQEDLTRPVDLGPIREKLKGVRNPETEPILRRLLQGKAPSLPSHLRVGENEKLPARWVAWQKVTSSLSVCVEDWVATEALLEGLIRPAWLDEAQTSPEDHTPWETVVELLKSARGSAPRRRAEWEAEKRLNQALFLTEVGRQTVDKSPAATDQPTEEEDEGGEGREETGSAAGAWLADLKDRGEVQVIEKKDGSWKLLPTPETIAALFRHAPILRERLHFNTLTSRVEIAGGPFVERDGRVEEIEDHHETRAQNWISKVFKVIASRETIYHQIYLVARENSYDPLVKYLGGLTWDGVKRVETFLVRYFGVSLITPEGEDISAYVRAVGMRWLISAVARGFEPGCKVDTVLHLEGPQGIGKSSALAVLGGEFFSDAAFDFRDQDSWAICARAWIIELGEMVAFSRSDEATAKSFLVRAEDDYRKKYARLGGRVKRRCVFAGTSNVSEQFRDLTGNRRSWPISCTAVDLEALKRDRDQLWAEAVQLYKAGEKWFLTEEERRIATVEAEKRTISDSYVEAIRDAYLRVPPERRKDKLTYAAVCDLLGERVATANSSRIGAALSALGFSKRRSTHERYYLAPQGLLFAPSRFSSESVSVVEQMTNAQVKA
jgi:predicted P-loop ATPase